MSKRWQFSILNDEQRVATGWGLSTLPGIDSNSGGIPFCFKNQILIGKIFQRKLTLSPEFLALLESVGGGSSHVQANAHWNCWRAQRQMQPLQSPGHAVNSGPRRHNPALAAHVYNNLCWLARSQWKISINLKESCGG